MVGVNKFKLHFSSFLSNPFSSRFYILRFVFLLGIKLAYGMVNFSWIVASSSSLYCAVWIPVLVVLELGVPFLSLLVVGNFFVCFVFWILFT